jgi:acetolactate synthase-1/2/3 large subunit
MIGIRFTHKLPTSFRWPFRPDGLKSVRIDIDPAEMRRFTPDAAVVADARAGTSELLAAVRKAGYAKTRGRRATIREASAAALLEIQKVQPQMAYLNILREVLPPNAIVSDELSQVGFTSWYGFPVYEPRTFITSGYQGTLGSGFPTRSARVAYPTAGRCDHGRWRLHVGVQGLPPPCSSTSAWWCWCSTITPMACGATARASKAAW